MSKAILVINTPNSCNECSLLFKDNYSDWCPVNIKNNQTDIYRYTASNTRPSWCPLRELPEKMEGYDSIKWQRGEYEDGWNHCIDYLIDE